MNNTFWTYRGLLCRVVLRDLGIYKFYCCYVFMNHPLVLTREELDFIRVHGGITYELDGMEFGFDCAHADDFDADSITHSRDWAREETERLVDQLLAIQETVMSTDDYGTELLSADMMQRLFKVEKVIEKMQAARDADMAANHTLFMRMLNMERRLDRHLSDNYLTPEDKPDKPFFDVVDDDEENPFGDPPDPPASSIDAAYALGYADGRASVMLEQGKEQ